MRPPFRLTRSVMAWCARIERSIGRCEGMGGEAPPPRLRRENHIRTAHATTAIEGNALSVDQVTALLEGRRVLGSAREIGEVKNALAAYELVRALDPHSEADLLRAHAVLMRGLAKDAGRYRRGEVGILEGSRVKHVAPPASRVPALMRDLFAFVAAGDDTPELVRAAVFHYELEFIHPFSDGNGRAGRLWHHALLCAYSPVLAHVPTESMIHAHQGAYYAALAASDRAGDATAFVSFSLERLHEALESFAAELRPARPSLDVRLELAERHFGARDFSRSDYLALHGSISAPTASRDLSAGVERGRLRRRGDKATARYAFVRSRARSRRE